MDAAEYPQAFRIASRLPVELLALRSRRLVRDIMAVTGCGLTTARRAVGWARRLARGERPL